MSSFRFGLWTGVVAGFVLAMLIQESEEQPPLSEILLAEKSRITPFGKTPAPDTLAGRLAKQTDQT